MHSIHKMGLKGTKMVETGKVHVNVRIGELKRVQSGDSDFIKQNHYLTENIHAIWKERRIRELNYLSSLLQPCGFSPPRSRELVPLVANLSQNINLPRLNASLLH